MRPFSAGKVKQYDKSIYPEHTRTVEIIQNKEIPSGWIVDFSGDFWKK